MVRLLLRYNEEGFMLTFLFCAECRNNVAPTYQPGPADVWSLGIVLINM